MREIVETLAFLAREDKRVDKRSGVSQRLPISALENVVSNSERRALKNQEPVAVPRVLDLYSALPAITGKLELEYEGELKGGDAVARELIRGAVGKVYTKYFEGANVSQIVQWFDLGGTLKLDETVDSSGLVQQLGGIQGLMEKVKVLGLTANEPDAVRASAAEFILEGLHAHRRISRSEERGFAAEEKQRRESREREEGKGERPNFRRQYN
jgi:magnesium chelatase subunit I